MNKILLLLALLNFTVFTSIAQQSPLKFGNVTKADLEGPLYPYEQGAEAVVLLDYADAKLIYTSSTNEEQTGFEVEVNRHVRIKILKSSGFDMANIAIDFYKDDRLSDLKAAVYNLDGDEISEIMLKRKEFSNEKVTAYLTRKRFTFPQVKEGTIIEYSYKIVRNSIWEFEPFPMQRSVPVRHAEFWAVYPEYFTYNIKRNGGNLIEEYHRMEEGYVNNNTTDFHAYRWLGRQLPAFQPEPYLPAQHEHVAGLQFELVAVQFPGGSDEFSSPTYKRYTERLMQSSDFGKSLGSYLLFSGVVNDLTEGIGDPYQKMESIYEHVRSHMKWDGDLDFRLSKPHKKAYKEQRGNSADINLMLVNMMNAAQITAIPVILSTRNHGTMHKLMAYDGNFNYVICMAEIQGRQYLLDATGNTLPMGYLPSYCLNGEGWLVSENRGRFIALHTTENDLHNASYNLTLSGDGTIHGSVILNYEGYIGFEIKNELKNLGFEEFKYNEIQEHLGGMQISGVELTGLEEMTEPVGIHFEMTSDKALQSAGNIAFLKPLDLHLTAYENPFIKEVREFPVNMPCPEIQHFNISIEIPEDYLIEEVPQSVRLVLPDDGAQFTYVASANENALTISGALEINKTYYAPEEYPALREFYTQIFRKMNEIIVFQKNETLSQTTHNP